MGKTPDGASRTLYHHLKYLRSSLPLIVFLIVVAVELVEYHQLARFVPLYSIPVDYLLYGVGAPVLVWLALDWLCRRIHERDEAEARLDASYQVSQDVANAPDMEALLQIAFNLPERLLGGVGTSLVMQATPDVSWGLVGTRGLTENQRASLGAFTSNAGVKLSCGECETLRASLHDNCPMLAALQNSPEPAPASAICLPLVKNHTCHVVLNMYLAKAEAPPSAEALHLLGSLAATLAVAMDRAHLRSRETQIWEQVEQAVHARNTSKATLRQILVDIAATYNADFGVVLLAPAEHGTVTQDTIVCWPGEKPNPQLAQAAEDALRTANPEVTVLSAETKRIMAIPLVAERQHVGVMVLSGHFPIASAQLPSLRVVASMMAMIVRTGQLYAALESQAALEERYRLAREVHDSLGQYLGFLNFKVQQAERALGRQQAEAAKRALHEARQSIDDLYAEVRLTIQDLRLPPKDSPGLVKRLRDIVSSYANSSHLSVSFTADGDMALAPEIETHLLRIVREALTNIQRHAQAHQAWVRVKATPEVVKLEVKDDGIGFSEPDLPQTLESFGLRMMQERVAALGGHFELHSAPGQGVLLQVSVPLPQEDAQL